MINKKDYFHRYYIENKVRLNELSHEYYLLHKKEYREMNKKYYEKNKKKISEYHKRYYKNNIDYFKEKNKLRILFCKDVDYERNKRWRNNIDNKKYRENHILSAKKYRIKYPLKIKSQSISNKIKIPKGTICSLCKLELAKEKHHENYNEPMNVIFLCIKCHKNIHDIKNEKKR